MQKARLVWELLRDASDGFSKDRGDLAAAALAFFALLSTAPLVIIAVAIAGVVLGRATARQEIQRLLTDAMGPQIASAVDRWVQQASEGGGLASVVGAVLLLWAASRFASSLKVALNQIWNIDVALEESFKATLAGYVRRRLFAFVLVLASGPLLLAVFLSRAVISGLGDAIVQEIFGGGTPFDSFLIGAGQLVFSLLIVSAGCTLIFRFVPDTRVGWKVAAMGGVVTSALFNVGNLLLGLYLGRTDVGQAYGIASSVAVALLWFYYASLIFIFGAEVTQVWASRFGRGLGPDEERQQQVVASEAERARKRHSKPSEEANQLERA